VTPGEVLAAKRGERGLTIRNVATATRIRAEYLAALESDDLERLPAPVYAKGYLRTYARYLGVDPEPLVEMLQVGAQDPRRRLGIGPQISPRKFAVTAPAVVAATVVLLGGAFAGYAWRQLQADQRPSADAPPQYADAGKMLDAGSVVYFTGLDAKITSGKAAATCITIDGRALGPLGAGVATRDFTSQTSSQASE
jgi:cytoskeletal protein RodZ